MSPSTSFHDSDSGRVAVVVAERVARAAPHRRGAEPHLRRSSVVVARDDLDRLQVADPVRVVVEVGDDVEQLPRRRLDREPLRRLLSHGYLCRPCIRSILAGRSPRVGHPLRLLRHRPGSEGAVPGAPQAAHARGRTPARGSRTPAGCTAGSTPSRWRRRPRRRGCRAAVNRTGLGAVPARKYRPPMPIRSVRLRCTATA